MATAQQKTRRPKSYQRFKGLAQDVAIQLDELIASDSATLFNGKVVESLIGQPTHRCTVERADGSLYEIRVTKCKDADKDVKDVVLFDLSNSQRTKLDKLRADRAAQK